MYIFRKGVIMTEEQCKTCAKPTAHCLDAQYKHLQTATCWNYTPKTSQSPDPAGAFLGILENTHSKIKPTLNPYNPADDNHEAL